VNHESAVVPEPLFDRLGDVAAALESARGVYLFLDFDGTLAPIVDDADVAAMPAESRELLRSLAARPHFKVAVISGRSMADVEQRVGLPQLTYSGNHGLEIRGPEVVFAEPTALALIPRLGKLVRTLEAGLSGMNGTRVENKSVSASVHYRKAQKGDRSEIRRIVAESVEPMQDLFQISEGLEVLDIRPRVKWNKGSAARRILASSENTGMLPIALGDEVTDEDIFRELTDGITVRIGRTGSTAARYRLDYQESVGEFLSWLAGLAKN
jgi:trehalose 6-phosphate phosphatase